MTIDGSDVEERVSGFRVRGSWEDVVAHGERITDALSDLGIDGDPLAEWNEWRPKAHERLETEVSARTVEQARTAEGPGEAAGQPASADLERAGEKAIESIEKAEGDSPEDVLEKWVAALEHALRAADTATRKALRAVETTVYEEVMTRFTPYYFDNALVSANIRRSDGETENEFVFVVDVNDDSLKQQLSRRFGTDSSGAR